MNLFPDAKLWYVRAGIEGCTAVQSTIQVRTAMPDSESRYEHSSWSEARPVQLSIPGYVPWHLDVLELPGNRGYLAMVASYQRFSNCANSDVWLASSPDGMTWRAYAVPIFARTMKAAKQIGISTWYRGTLRYDPFTDMVDLWPSGMSKSVWGVYHATAKLSDLLALLESALPSDFHPPAFNQSVNPMPLQMP